MKTLVLLVAFSFSGLLIAQGGFDTEPPSKTEEKEIGPRDVVFIEKEPLPINLDDIKNAIGYPSLAKRNSVQGKVIIRIQVDKKGDYVKHLVLRNPDPLLTEAVEKQIPRLKFTPGIQAGKPLKFWVTIPFDFRLMMSPEEEAWTKQVKNVGQRYYSLESALAAPNPKAVTQLFLNDAGLKAFPTEILQFSNLNVLELSYNNIESIPLEIEKLAHLRFLNISNNRIKNLPESLFKISTLEAVNIGNNHFITKSVRKKVAKKHGDKLFPHDGKGRVKWD